MAQLKVKKKRLCPWGKAVHFGPRLTASPSVLQGRKPLGAREHSCPVGMLSDPSPDLEQLLEEFQLDELAGGLAEEFAAEV